MVVTSDSQGKTPKRDIASLYWTLALCTLFVNTVLSDTLRNIVGWKGHVVLDNTRLTVPAFAALTVGNAQQCLRLCWLYKACTVVTYLATHRTCHLTSIDEPDLTSDFQTEISAVTFDMRSAEVDEAKPRGCDTRPCDADHLCVPVVMASQYRCLASVHQYCPDPPPTVAQTLALNDGVQDVHYQCPSGYVKAGTQDVATCDRSTGRWSSVAVSCSFVECSPPPEVANALKHGNDTQLNAKVSYTCLDGHVSVSTTMTITCQENGQWTPIPALCEFVRCPVPDDAPEIVFDLIERPEADRPAGLSQLDFQLSFGGKMKRTCNAGYTSSPAAYFTSACQADGTWSTSPSFRCVKVDCGTPPLVANAWSFVNATTFRSRADYECRDGYKSATERIVQLECGPAGTWDGPEVVCRLVDCGPVPDVRIATPIYDSTAFGAQVNYTCNSPGFPMPNGTRTSTCQADGRWSNVTLDCIQCGPPPEVNNATYNFLPIIRASYFGVRYHCDAGFKMNSGGAMLCLKDNPTWTGEPADCQPITCNDPGFDYVTNADANFTSLTYGSVSTFKCHEGFKLTGNENNATCLDDHLWVTASGQDIRCEPATCGDPPAVENATSNVISAGLPNPADRTIASSLYAYNSTVVYQCFGDSVLTTASNTKRCTSDGDWDETPVRCHPMACDDPPEVANANSSVVTKNRTIGAIAVYTCSEGYQLARNISNNTCLQSLQWSRDDIECVPMLCGPVPWVNNSYAVVYREYQTVIAEYVCHQSFFAIDNVQKRSCPVGGGNWTDNFIECALNVEEILCPEPDHVNNSVSSYSSRRPGGIVLYECEKGYEHWWFESRTCAESGVWSDQRVACVMVHCGEPPIVAYATLDYKDTVYGSRVNYTCADGYRYPRGGSKVCQGDGKWSADLVECLEDDISFCPAPPVEPFGTVNISSLIPGAAVANVTCHPGYNRDGDTYALTCGVDLQWQIDNESTGSQCTPVECAVPPQEVPNAEEHHSENAFGDSATYKCNDGFTRVGPESRKCLENGQWDNALIECLALTDLKCPEPVNVPEGAKVSMSSYKEGAHLSYTCIDGYRGKGQANCTLSGHWVWEGSGCHPITCMISPPQVPDAAVDFSLATYRSIAVYQCHEQFRQIGAYRAVCASDSTWTIPEESPCRPLDTCAGLIPEVANADAEIGIDDQGLSLRYICKDNHIPSSTMEQPMVRRCLWTGQWSREHFECQYSDVACLAAPDVPNAHLLELFADQDTLTSASYVCNDGFSLSQARSLRDSRDHIELLCRNTSGWSAPTQSCELIDCGYPLNQIAGTTIQVNTTSYMSEARHVCQAPAIGSSYTSVCQADGRWSRVHLTCILQCIDPPVITNGIIILEAAPNASDTLSTPMYNDPVFDYDNISNTGTRTQDSQPALESASAPALEPESARALEPASADELSPELAPIEADSPRWKVVCDAGFTYLGPQLNCSRDGDRQVETWQGLEEATCERTNFEGNMIRTPFYYQTRMDKRKYFDVINLCASGTYTNPGSKTGIIIAIRREEQNQRNLLMIVINPKMNQLDFLRRRKVGSSYKSFILEQHPFKVEEGDALSVCIGADFEKLEYSASANNISIVTSQAKINKSDVKAIKVTNMLIVEQLDVEYT